MVRPRDSFLFGSGSVVVPGNLALRLWSGSDLEQLLIRARRERDDQLVEMLEALRIAGQRSKAPSAGPIIGPLSRPQSDIAPGSNYISTRQAADLMHVTTRHVVRRIHDGTIVGQLVGGRWQVDPKSVPLRHKETK